MKDPLEDLLKPFHAAASKAHVAEANFSREFERERARRKRDREFAFRRLGLIKALAAVANVKEEKESIEAQLAVLCNELGWFDVTDAKQKALDDFVPVARAIHGSFVRKRGGTKVSVTRAFSAFERKYEKATGKPFLALLDHEIPELPLVDL